MKEGSEEKRKIKFLLITDIHDRIQNVRKVVSNIKKEKFDYVICCGDVVNIPTGDNADKTIVDSFMPLMRNIYLELEKIAPILWIPGNHDPYVYFSNYYEEVASKSKNLDKKFEKIEKNLYIVGLGGSTPMLSGVRWTKDFIPFKNIDLNKYKYAGYPYNDSSNNYIDSDKMLINDFNEVINKGKKVWEESQLIFLTHNGPLFSHTNIMEEEGEYLYLGSKNIGEMFEKEENCFINIHGHSHLSEGFITIRQKNIY